MATGIKIDILRDNLRQSVFSTMRVSGKVNFSDGFTKFLPAVPCLKFANCGAGVLPMPALVDLNPGKVARCGVCHLRHGQQICFPGQ